MIVNKVEEALAFIQQHVDSLNKKLDQTAVAFEKLETYPDLPALFGYALQYVNNNGEYNSSSYFKPHDCKTLEAIAAREAALLKVIDDTEAAQATVKAKNEEILVHNRQVVDKIKTFMNVVGIPTSYSERDYKSRARTPKYNTHQAGYLADIVRNIPTADAVYSQRLQRFKAKRAEVNKWAAYSSVLIREAERARQLDAKEIKKQQFLATCRVQYNLEYDADENEVLEAILEQDKYLHLASCMEANRNDWNDGPDLASRGLDRFKIESAVDQKIYDCVEEAISDWDGDGRVFRDMEWNYGVIYSLVEDASLMKNYLTFRELFDS